MVARLPRPWGYPLFFSVCAFISLNVRPALTTFRMLEHLLPGPFFSPATSRQE